MCSLEQPWSTELFRIWNHVIKIFLKCLIYQFPVQHLVWNVRLPANTSMAQTKSRLQNTRFSEDQNYHRECADVYTVGHFWWRCMSRNIYVFWNRQCWSRTREREQQLLLGSRLAPQLPHEFAFSAPFCLTALTSLKPLKQLGKHGTLWWWCLPFRCHLVGHLFVMVKWC